MSESWTPPLSLLVHIAHQVVTRPRGTAGERTGPVLWIGRRVWPYGRALVRAGPGGARLLARSLFVAIPGSRVPDDAAARDGDAGARLWALDLALRCRAVAAVVADGSGFAMAASRRLQVAAEAGQAFVLLARPPEELDVPSAAGVRFVVTHVPAEVAQTPTRGPALAWSLELRRAKGAAAREAASGGVPEHSVPEHSVPQHSVPEHSVPEHSVPEQVDPEQVDPESADPGHAKATRFETGPWVHTRRTRALHGPAVVLVGDAVHGVIERGTAPGSGDGLGAGLGRGRAADAVVVPTDLLDRPRTAATRADAVPGSSGSPGSPGSPVASAAPAAPVTAGAARRRRTRARR